jgi:hypothetical protein
MIPTTNFGSYERGTRVPRISEDQPLRRICVNVYESDMQVLEKLATAAHQPVSLFLRTAIHNFVVRGADKVRQRIDQMESDK